MNFHIYEHPAAMSEAAAEWITAYIEKHLSEKQKFTFLLTGGNTPKDLYSLLSTERFSKRIDWKKITFFFGDERFVPYADPRNNGNMVFELLLKQVPVPVQEIHFIQTDIDKEESALQYEMLLREHFPGSEKTFDLALAGIGNDGHTLSVFPGSTTMFEQMRWVVPSEAPEEPVQRITLTPIVVKHSACILVLAAGKNKAAILDKIIHGEYNPQIYPGQIFRGESENIHWFTDNDAMELVIKNKL